LALVATTVKPDGAAATKSPWLAQTRISLGTSANSGTALGQRHRRVAELALRRRRHRAAEGVRHQLHAVADAQDRRPRHRRALDHIRGAPASRTLFGPPDRMIPTGLRDRNRSAGVSGAQISE
jgi:hypothetical protein